VRPYITNNTEGLVQDSDLFFKEKENGRGASMYKKLILDTKCRYRLKDADIQYGLKETGKWLHEDDFGQKFICPHNKVIHIVVDGNWISETYVPNIGWLKGIQAVEARTRKE